MNALNGIAFAPTEVVEVFGVVPDVVPALCDDPEVVTLPAKTVGDALITADDGVYLTAVVSAFDPADADAEDEKEVDAPAPLAPEDALA